LASIFDEFDFENVYILGICRHEKVNTLMVQTEQGNLDFLRKMALDLGASDAKIISANKIVVEDRVVLKCKVGCTNYGKTLTCPPYTPSANEFRNIVSEFSWALFMKFTSKAEADSELQKSLSITDASNLPKETKEKADRFWAAWKKDKAEILASVVKLEKEAMSKGYSLAVSFVSGSCQLCDKCQTETRICIHPEMARPSEDAVGVNVKKTAENAGIKFVFPFPKNPESFALLLID
jgi:predicted metal-binding protein